MTSAPQKDVAQEWRQLAIAGFGLPLDQICQPPIPERFKAFYRPGEDEIAVDSLFLSKSKPAASWMTEGLYGCPGLSYFTQFCKGGHSEASWPLTDFFSFSYSGHGVVSYAFGAVCFQGRTGVVLHSRYSRDYPSLNYPAQDSLQPVFDQYRHLVALTHQWQEQGMLAATEYLLIGTPDDMVPGFHWALFESADPVHPLGHLTLENFIALVKSSPFSVFERIRTREDLLREWAAASSLY
jgi:hypothetical protein